MKKFESYKNWINEKFSEETDPVHDMDIGIKKVMDDYFKDKLFPLYFNSLHSRMEESIRNNKIDFVRYLITKISNLNYMNGVYLALAVRRNYLEIVKMLLDSGADINIAPNLLTIAIESASDEMLKYLIDNGIEITEYKLHQFLKAVSTGKISKVQMLMDAGIETTQEMFNQGLSITAQKGDIPMMKFLINIGAKPSQYLKRKVEEWKKKNIRVKVRKFLKQERLI
jgi:ankyrin repeat protein